jgi:drug/metabolite transporter (DMT)-like permease
MTAVTAVWGYSFLLVHDAVALYPVFPFLAIRFTLATLVLSPFLLRRTLKAGFGAIAGGFWMGVALFAGYAFQTWGLTFTSAAHGGFITGLFVVLTPIFEGVLTRRWAAPASWAAVALATLGLALLSLQGGISKVNVGDLLSLACAGVYTVHLILTSRMARRYDTGALVLAQIATVAVLSWAGSVPFARTLLPLPRPVLTGILVTALFATCVAYYVQTAYQAKASALQTAVIFTLEPVFAGLFAVVLGGERLGWRGISGGALIVLAMFVGQVSESRAQRARGETRP